MDLTLKQRAEAQRLYGALQAPLLDQARRRARLLASKADAPLRGPAEFEVRDAVHRLGAAALQAALERKKKGDQGRAPARPHCRADARRKGFRRRTALRVLVPALRRDGTPHPGIRMERKK